MTSEKHKQQARVWRRIHLTMTILWFVGGSLATLVWLSDSVPWVAWMSVYAIVTGHWSGYQGARAEDA